MRKAIQYTFLLLLLHAGLFTPSAKAQIATDPADSLMLIEIYNALGGENWPTSWDLDQAAYYWPGVEVHPTTGKVYELNLSQRHLNGVCPLLEFSDLITLNLSSNQITGFVGFNLPLLEILRLRTNSVVDFVFPDLTGSPNLRILDLTQTVLTGTFPDVEFLSNLTELYIGQNELTGPIPDLNLPQLERLYLNYNMFTGEIPNFSNLPNLQFFFAGYNPLEGSLPAFDQTPLMEYLVIEFTDVTGEIPNFNFPFIDRLFLNSNNLTGNIPNFNNLPLLTFLNLDNNALSGNIPDFNLPSIDRLTLTRNDLDGEIPDFDLPTLTILNLGNNNLSGAIPSFGNLPDLRTLLLNDNNLTGNIPDLLTPSLSSFYVDYNQLTGPIPDFQTIENIQILSIRDNDITGQIPDFGRYTNMSAFIAQNTKLEGCYPLFLCDVSSVRVTENPGLPGGGSEEVFELFCANYSSQFGAPCDDGDPNTIGETIQPDCNCATTNSFTNFAEGIVFADTIENCTLDNDEMLLSNWLVTAVGTANTYYDVTDSLGQYKVYADSGSYELHFEMPNNYWTICPNIQDTPLNFNVPSDNFYLDAPLQGAFSCPVLNVDISTPLLRRCFHNTYYLHYSNEGTVGAEDAYIEVTFDEFTTIHSSSPPWASLDGQTVTFDLGDVPVGEYGDFQILTSLNCENTYLGQTHCTEARIFPDSICLPNNSLWDGSTVEVDAECREDSIQFFLQNVGDNDMSMPLNYYIVIDDLIHRTGNFILPSGGVDSTSEQTTGATFRLAADQAAFHPTNSAPSISIEGCIEANGPVSMGFVTIFPDDDADPFVSIDCQQNIGSFDPNDKRGYPVGLGPNHLIDSTTTLDYKIRFQNTGTDTAFLVVVRDTLSPFLDPASIKMGAASHAYEWEILGTNTLQVVFADIMLPDSNVNEVQSHGFFKFEIAQQATNEPGTLIENDAAIFFDFNDPVITNQTNHLVEDRFIVFDTVHTTYCNHWLYEENTVLETQSTFAYYDLFVTNYITIGENSTTVIDTFLIAGTTFDGIHYPADTSLVYNYPLGGGCDSLVIFNLDILNGVDDLNSNSEVQVFPNPSTGKAYFLFDLEHGQTLKTLYLYNAIGQLVYTQNIQAYFSEGQQVDSFDMEGLPEGVYTIRLLGTELDWVGKIVKQ